MRSRSAAAIGTAVRNGETTATEQIELALERAAEASELNMFTQLDPGRARQKAAALDARIAAGELVGPLAGVPVGIKDLINEEGVPNTCGASFAPFTPAAGAPCVLLLEEAGAIPLGRTGLHEFAFGFSSENPWFGPVRNPIDPALSPGGSSGGSAAAVAAGVVPVALGTDTGGSVRVPAALCGVVGLKVTRGRGSIRGVYPLASTLDTVGPLATTVADAELAYRVIGVHDPQDPHSAEAGIAATAEAAALDKLSMAVPHPWVDTGYEPRVAADFTATLDRLAAMGVTIHHVSLPEVVPPGLGIDSAYYEVWPVHRTRFEADPSAYGADVQIRLRDAAAVTATAYAAALDWRKRVRLALEELLQSHHAVITPTCAALTKPIGQETLELSDGPADYRSPLSHFTALVNHAGLPALALPIETSGAPPFSLQLIGDAWDESTLLSIGKALEDAGFVAPKTV